MTQVQVCFLVALSVLGDITQQLPCFSVSIPNNKKTWGKKG